VTYAWLRGDNKNWVRPDLNAYMFISYNGNLYFSEVHREDENDYRCVVRLTGNGAAIGTNQPPSRISLPIPLIVNEKGTLTIQSLLL
jgi:hypothetical protein